jgi:hypothetical protein
MALKLLEYKYLEFPKEEEDIYIYFNPSMVCYRANGEKTGFSFAESAGCGAPPTERSEGNRGKGEARANGRLLITARRLQNIGSNTTEWAHIKDIIPGNHPKCEGIDTDDVGRLFAWNNWNFPNKLEPATAGLEKTQMYLADMNGDNLQKLNVPYQLTQQPDARVACLNQKYYFYNSNLERIFEIVIEDKTVEVVRQLNFMDIETPLVGINMVPLEINTRCRDTDVCLKYLDWYLHQGLSMYQVVDFQPPNSAGWVPDYYYFIHELANKKDWKEKFDNQNYEVTDGILIKYNHGLHGKGSTLEGITDVSRKDEFPDCVPRVSGKDAEVKAAFKEHYGRLPGFSFGTPVIELGSSNKFLKCYLGCGHTKIKNPIACYPYKIGSKVEEFRIKTHRDMKAKFGANYKLHVGSSPAPDCFGYIYMLYFYILYQERQSKRWKMFISDSYLPISFNDGKKYKFSLIFPMGICLNGNMIMVSAGEGDYYSVLMKFDKKSVIKSCIHDLETLSMDNYEYYHIWYDASI